MAAGKKQARVVLEMAKATGVAVEDVAKVLGQLGLDRIQAEVIRANRGKAPGLDAAKVAFKIGKSTVII